MTAIATLSAGFRISIPKKARADAMIEQPVDGDVTVTGFASRPTAP